MDPHLLQDIGLTAGEAKVYLALLALGTTTTGPLAAKAGVSSSKVYKILDRLIKKGLVGHVTRGKIKYFSAFEPKRILEYIEEKENTLHHEKTAIQMLLPQLELAHKRAKEKSQALIYEGFKAIKNFYLGILDELHPDETYYVIGAGYGKESPGVKEFFQNFHTQRAKKKIGVKMLANFDVKGKLVHATSLHSEIRFLPQYLITDMSIIFYKHKAFIFFLTEEPIGFLMINEEAVKSFKTYFDTFWKIAKSK